MCHWKGKNTEAKLRPRIWQNMFFPYGCLGNVWRYSLAMNFWGWGRKRENFWPVEDKDYMNNMLVPRAHFLHARENFSLFKIKHFYWCYSVWKRKAKEVDVGRKESCVCEYGLASAILAPAPLGWRVVPIPSVPVISLGSFSCHGADLRVSSWGEEVKKQMADVRVHLPFRLYLPFSQMRAHRLFVVNCVS